jgi:hypothetical protein
LVEEAVKRLFELGIVFVEISGFAAALVNGYRPEGMGPGDHGWLMEARLM